MASSWLQSASLLVLLVMLCPESSSAQDPQHLCGSHLVEALNLVCGNKGFYSSPRRDVLPSNENEIKDQMGMMVKRHIVEQCCHRPCSLAVLEMYCN